MKAISLKILEFLLSSSSPQNISSIARHINTNYSNTYQNIMSMQELSISRLGNNSLISLKPFLTPLLYQAHHNRLLFFKKSQDIQHIYRKINKTPYPFVSILLFGSRLDKKATNDIDICIICDNNLVIKQIRDELETLSYSLDVHSFSVNEFKQMITLKSSNLGNEIIKKNLVLKGLENYYELLRCQN
jgi:predicted nucleotidyltransferase